jgi:hypothetical protein
MFALFLASAVAGDSQPTLAERGLAHRRSVHVHRNDPVSVDAKLDLGERVFNSLAVADADVARKLREGECDARVPRGFWRKFIEGELNLRYSDRQRVKVRCALLFWVCRSGPPGAATLTRIAMRGSQPGGSCRTSGAARNRKLADGLDFKVLQCFADCVQRLSCRADSTLIMNHVRELRGYLRAHGWDDDSLPKLVGNAGAQWFKRWRKHYGIVFNISGMKLKVSWRKVCRRVRVLLTNIFRLRAFVGPWCTLVKKCAG